MGYNRGRGGLKGGKRNRKGGVYLVEDRGGIGGKDFVVRGERSAGGGGFVVGGRVCVVEGI